MWPRPWQVTLMYDCIGVIVGGRFSTTFCFHDSALVHKFDAPLQPQKS